MDIEELENKMVEMILSQPERQQIKEIENQIFESKETLVKISFFRLMESEYNYAMRDFKHDEQLIKEKQQALYRAKKELDEDPLVSEYTKLLSKCNDPLRYLEYNLIKLFQRRGNHQC